MKRIRLTERQVVEALIRQGAVIPCAICRVSLTLDSVKYIDRDHYRARHTFPDEDLIHWNAIENQRYVHGLKDPNHDCHRRKTDGLPHTSVGSDKHMAAKGRRLRGETKQKPKAKIRSRNTLSKEYRDGIQKGKI